MNVLVVFSDQQHKFALGKRDEAYQTPFLDALCKDGVCFTEAYSNNPVCGPYRGCLMTGQLPSHCGVLRNADPLPLHTQTMAMAMQQVGYQTGYVGKYHLGGMGNIPIVPEQRRGFQHFMGYQCYNGFDPNPPFNNEVVFFNENDERHEYHAHRTDVTTDLACDMLDKMNDEQPFFMMVSYQAPHYPEQPSPAYEALYKDTVFDTGEDYIQCDPYTQTYSPPSVKPKENDPDYQRYGGDIQSYLRLYAGLCSQIDAGVGRLIAALKEKGVYEDTLIVYTADHGDMQGSRGLNNKCEPYEKSAGVPMIVRLPNGRKNEMSTALVSAVDIFPTVLDLANGQTTTALDGVSWLPYLKGKTEKVQDYVISEFSMSGRHWRFIRSDSYKLICELDYTPRELYQMKKDPHEQKNLVSEPEMQLVVEALRSKLKERTRAILKDVSDDVMNT